MKVKRSANESCRNCYLVLIKCTESTLDYVWFMLMYDAIVMALKTIFDWHWISPFDWLYMYMGATSNGRTVLYSGMIVCLIQRYGIIIFFIFNQYIERSVLSKIKRKFLHHLNLACLRRGLNLATLTLNKYCGMTINPFGIFYWKIPNY